MCFEMKKGGTTTQKEKMSGGGELVRSEHHERCWCGGHHGGRCCCPPRWPCTPAEANARAAQLCVDCDRWYDGEEQEHRDTYCRVHSRLEGNPGSYPCWKCGGRRECDGHRCPEKK
jgi:hypothetical protein